VGERDAGPLRVGNVVSDMLAGTNAFSGVLLALLQRATSGTGTDVNVSLLDSIVAFQAPPLTEFLLTGQVPRRLGNEHPLIAPSGAMETADGAICFTVFDHQWQGFCNALGMEQLAADPRFTTSADRQRHRDALRGALAPAFAAGTRAEWLRKLRAMDVLCAPINDYEDLVADAQVRHNGLLGTTVGAGERAYPSIRNPVRLPGESVRPLAPPLLGQHTREVLRDACGLAPAEIEQLVGRGVALALQEDPVHA
jgi:crotonobetainyl-CoA:carnitine CoA-transferase CaiB-like acyl-CoA transferase